MIEGSIITKESQDHSSTIIKEKLLEEAREKHKEIIQNAEMEAKKIIDSAYQESERILDTAYEKAKKISEESKIQGYNEGYEIGKEKGFDEGYKTGYDEGKMESEKLIQEALDIKKAYIEKRNNLLKEAEEELIHLVIAIYEKVLAKRVEEDEEIIVSLVLKGIENLEIDEKLTIIVSQYDYHTVNKYKDQILAKASLIDELDIRVSSDMEKGDCILETSKGAVDVSINKQLEEVKELLINILNNE